mmetsp:Transcript_19587/g.24216  ORF Transcript_19587/g.24216 Transcript_19587/m.24216 type:complete len:209 (-) Transcript_19587:17-643(-)
MEAGAGSPGVATWDCAAAGTAATLSTVAAAGTYSLTSAAMTRPLGPVPAIREISNPFCFARVCAKGDATIRPAAGVDDVVPVAGGTAAAGAGGAATAAGAGGVGAADAAAGSASSTVKLSKAAISSSFSTVTMIGVPQGTSAAPSSTKIFAMYPSSCASKSTVALSVSTWQKTSPAINSSPFDFVQADIDPDSIVGDRDGRPTTSWGG